MHSNSVICWESFRSIYKSFIKYDSLRCKVPLNYLRFFCCLFISKDFFSLETFLSEYSYSVVEGEGIVCQGTSSYSMHACFLRANISCKGDATYVTFDCLFICFYDQDLGRFVPHGRIYIMEFVIIEIV